MHTLMLSLTGSILLGKSLQCSPALQKAGFPGCSKTPLNVSSTTCPDPAGIRQRFGAPATSCPEAHFLHPGRGGRQTSEGGGGLAVSSGDHRRSARLGKGPSNDPGCSWRARRKASILPANAKASVRARSSGKGPRKTAARQQWGLSEVCGDGGVGESRRSPATPGTDAPGDVQNQLGRGRETGARTLAAKGAPRGREMPAARRSGGRPFSLGSALQKKPLLVTGRERRQPRTHAPPPPPKHTHPDPLQPPTSPAGQLPSSPEPGLQRWPPARTAPTRL